MRQESPDAYESGQPLVPGFQKEIEKRKQRQRALMENYGLAFDRLKGGLLEIGSGHGHWLTAYAQNHPETFCVGVDLIAKRVSKSISKKEKRDLDNLLFVKAEAIEFIELLPDSASLKSVVVLFPDPWPKKRHHRRRLIQESFLSLMARKMGNEGLLYFRTDHAPYFEWATEHIEAHADWDLINEFEWPMELPTYFQVLMREYQSLCARVKK
jgi:tRNA (guanine-N7-)-methyltransferase